MTKKSNQQGNEIESTSSINLEKNPNHLNKTKTNRFGFILKKWFFGIVKDISRVSWHKKQNIVKECCVCLFIVFIFAVIFWAIDLGMMKLY